MLSADAAGLGAGSAALVAADIAVETSVPAALDRLGGRLGLLGIDRLCWLGGHDGLEVNARANLLGASPAGFHTNATAGVAALKTLWTGCLATCLSTTGQADGLLIDDLARVVASAAHRGAGVDSGFDGNPRRKWCVRVDGVGGDAEGECSQHQEAGRNVYHFGKGNE